MLEEHDSILLAYAWVVHDGDDNKLADDDPRDGQAINVVLSGRRCFRREADTPATVTVP